MHMHTYVNSNMQETVYARAGGAEDSGAVAHGASVSSVLVAGLSRRGLALRSVAFERDSHDSNFTSMPWPTCRRCMWKDRSFKEGCRNCVLSCLCFAVGQGHVFLTQAVIFAATHLTAFMMHHDHLHDVSHDSCSLAWNRRF